MLALNTDYVCRCFVHWVLREKDEGKVISTCIYKMLYVLGANFTSVQLAGDCYKLFTTKGGRERVNRLRW